MDFDSIYNQFKNMVYNLSLHFVQNNADAEEITQDVFVSVYQSLGQFRKDAELSTWIYRITINKCKDHIKAQNRKKRFAKYHFLTN